MIKSRIMRWMGHAARMGKMRNPYKSFIRKPEEKIPLEKTRRRWKDNVRMDLSEKGWEPVDWIYLAHDRDQWRDLVNRVMNLLHGVI
jgi:hypothetical protein